MATLFNRVTEAINGNSKPNSFESADDNEIDIKFDEDNAGEINKKLTDLQDSVNNLNEKERKAEQLLKSVTKTIINAEAVRNKTIKNLLSDLKSLLKTRKNNEKSKPRVVENSKTDTDTSQEEETESDSSQEEETEPDASQKSENVSTGQLDKPDKIKKGGYIYNAKGTRKRNQKSRRAGKKSKHKK